ncbi:hypothetical protein TNCV_4614281 [Trichonephila clavipes]|nr:hypothetical protein TNCV_4614281 [Trichonephila clavipes]
MTTPGSSSNPSLLDHEVNFGVRAMGPDRATSKGSVVCRLSIACLECPKHALLGSCPVNTLCPFYSCDSFHGNVSDDKRSEDLIPISATDQSSNSNDAEIGAPMNVDANIYTAGQLLRTDNTIIHSNHKMKGSKMWKIRISAGY